MESWVSAITEVGFPVVVTLYLLHRIERKLDVLNQSIQRLPAQLLADRQTSFIKSESKRSYN